MRNNRFDIDWEGVLFVVTLVIVFCIIAMSMMGCGVSRELRERVSSDTVYVASREVRVDSVWVDRYRNVYVSGDTVHDVRYEVKEKYVFLDRVDTLLHTVVDSVFVEKETSGGTAGHVGRSWYDRFVSWGFWILLALALGYATFRVVKWVVKK